MLNGQLLHAHLIGFLHPVTNEYMEFSKEIPEYFEEVLAKLRGRMNRICMHCIVKGLTKK